MNTEWLLVYQEELCKWYAVQNYYQLGGSSRGYGQRNDAYRAGCRLYGKHNFYNTSKKVAA